MQAVENKGQLAVVTFVSCFPRADWRGGENPRSPSQLNEPKKDHPNLPIHRQRLITEELSSHLLKNANRKQLQSRSVRFPVERKNSSCPRRLWCWITPRDKTRKRASGSPNKSLSLVKHWQEAGLSTGSSDVGILASTRKLLKKLLRTPPTQEEK